MILYKELHTVFLWTQNGNVICVNIIIYVTVNLTLKENKEEIMWFDKTMSESIKNIAAAQLKVQKEIKDISKDSTGYGYKYTSFDKLVQYLRPLLAKHGISFIQMPVGGDKYDEGNGTVGLQTLYMHAESGEWITNVIKSPVAESKGMNQYQSIGSAITYFRRYSLSSFVGIASEEDADAASKESPGRKPTTNKGEDEW